MVCELYLNKSIQEKQQSAKNHIQQTEFFKKMRGGWQNISEQKAYLCIIFQGGPRKQNIFIASKEENWWLKDTFGGNFTLYYLFAFFEFISCAILWDRFTMKLMKLKLWAPPLHRLFRRPQEGPKNIFYICL